MTAAAINGLEKDTGDVLLEQGKINASQLEQVRRRRNGSMCHSIGPFWI